MHTKQNTLNPAPYDTLTPDAVLDAVESIGLEPTGGLTALNSYENRVYQVAMEDGSFVITKFYRPNRWTDEAILEEHAFTRDCSMPSCQWCRRYALTAIASSNI